MRRIRSLILGLSLSLVSACTSIPEGIEPVTDFDLDRYLGKWYEIARLDHSFERGLSKVTADYSINSDGSIRVLNRGFSEEEGSWDEAVGKAYPVDDHANDADKGHLKVSFFGPFYASYVIAQLDPQYQYAYVTGPDTSYLWLLARTPDISESIKKDFEAFAAKNGFDAQGLIWVEH